MEYLEEKIDAIVESIVKNGNSGTEGLLYSDLWKDEHKGNTAENRSETYKKIEERLKIEVYDTVEDHYWKNGRRAITDEDFDTGMQYALSRLEETLKEKEGKGLKEEGYEAQEWTEIEGGNRLFQNENIKTAWTDGVTRQYDRDGVRAEYRMVVTTEMNRTYEGTDYGVYMDIKVAGDWGRTHCLQLTMGEREEEDRELLARLQATAGGPIAENIQEHASSRAIREIQEGAEYKVEKESYYVEESNYESAHDGRGKTRSEMENYLMDIKKGIYRDEEAALRVRVREADGTETIRQMILTDLRHERMMVETEEMEKSEYNETYGVSEGRQENLEQTNEAERLRNNKKTQKEKNMEENKRPMTLRPISEEGWKAEMEHFTGGKWHSDMGYDFDGKEEMSIKSINEMTGEGIAEWIKGMMQPDIENEKTEAVRITLREADGSDAGVILYTDDKFPNEALEGCDINVNINHMSVMPLSERAMALAQEMERERMEKTEKEEKDMTPEQKRETRAERRRSELLESLIDEDRMRSLNLPFDKAVTALASGEKEGEYTNLIHLISNPKMGEFKRRGEEPLTIELKNAEGVTLWRIAYCRDENAEETIKTLRPDLTVSKESLRVRAVSEKARDLATENNKVKILNRLATSQYTTYRNIEKQEYEVLRQIRYLNPGTGAEGWMKERRREERSDWRDNNAENERWGLEKAWNEEDENRNALAEREELHSREESGKERIEDINEMFTAENSEWLKEEYLRKSTYLAVVETAVDTVTGKEIIRVGHATGENFDDGTFKGRADIIINDETARKRVLTAKGAEFLAERLENPVMRRETEFLAATKEAEGAKERTERTAREIKEKTDIKKGERPQIINNQNSFAMAEKNSAAKAAEQEKAQKEIYGSVYMNTNYQKDGKTIELSNPAFSITFDMDKVEAMTPDKGGNLRFSIHERQDAKALAEANKPTCIIRENTYLKDKKIDAFSKCDILISKEDLMKLAKQDGDYGKRAYVMVTASGQIVPMKKYYEGEEIKISGNATRVDSVGRQMLRDKQNNNGEVFDLNKAVGHAWKVAGGEGKKDFFNAVLNQESLKHLPIDENKKIHLAVRALKERKGENGPTHIIIPELSFISGKVDMFSEKDFELTKSQVLDQRATKEESVTVNDKVYNRKNVYIQITSDNKVFLNNKRYPELEEKQADGTNRHTFMIQGEAHDVDQEARKAEIARRSELAQKKAEKPEEKKAAAQKKTKGQGI